MASPELVAEQARLREVIDALSTADVYAIDTEFHRERTYYPKLALIQVAWDDQLALLDPLALDIEPFAEVLRGPALAVVHAATQDLEVLDHACGAVPSRLFDTQIAAGFLGMSTPSLAALHERELGKRLPKGDRLTDWLVRPLTPNQLDYAASDVADLLQLRDRLLEQLETFGRVQWAIDECDELARRGPTLRDPDLAYLRIKEARQLSDKALGVARAIAGWRERRAAEIDQPVRFVLPDLAVVSVAQRAPKTVEDLRRLRGVDDRHARGDIGAEILEAVAQGLANPVEKRTAAQRRDLPPELRPALGLISAWVSQLSREQKLDTTLLATRADLESLLRGDDDARLASGWRADLVGGPIRALLGGHAALAFSGEGGLVLEKRSHEPLEISTDSDADVH